MDDVDVERKVCAVAVVTFTAMSHFLIPPEFEMGLTERRRVARRVRRNGARRATGPRTPGGPASEIF